MHHTMRQIIVLLLTFFLCFGVANAQATVNFTFTTPTNYFCSPQLVTFTQACTGNPTNFIWNFGNGQQGSSNSQVVNYSMAGNYTVSLTAVYENEAITTTKVITINPTPVVTLSASANYLCQPGMVTFTAGNNVPIATYVINYGDGTAPVTNTNPTFTHNYTAYGNYTATVTGTTAAGCTATAQQAITVAKFAINGSVSPSSGCISTLATLTAIPNLPPGDAPLNYAWVYGNATPNATTPTGTTTNTYSTTTTITTASVTITSVLGCTNQFNFGAFAYGTPPTGLQVTATGGRTVFCGSETIGITATALNANAYTYNYGDGTIITTSSTSSSHKYLTLGNKNITVTPFFNGCAGTPFTLNITVTGVIANYTFTNSCAAKSTYQFNNTSQGTYTSYSWVYSNIPTMPNTTVYSPTYNYPSSGEYTTKLLLTDAASGCNDSLITTQYTATPMVNATATQVCKDSAITYSVTNSYVAASNYQYTFYLNGQVYGNGANTVLLNKPATHGTYNNFVVISNPAGNTCNDTLVITPTTQVNGPTAAFTTTTQQCLVNAFVINNTSTPYIPTSNIASYRWSYGDGTIANTPNPAPHNYLLAGTYNIGLKVTDINNCADSITQTITVNPMPLLKVFPKRDTLCLGQVATLYAYTVDTLLWRNTANITCNTCDTTQVQPTATVQYIAQAKNNFGCITTDTATIIVYQPFTFTINPADTFVCPKQQVVLRPTIQGVITWQPSTYLSSTTVNQPISSPDTSITYIATIADSVGCFTNTASVTINTYPRPTVNAAPNQVLAYNSPFTLNPTYSSNVSAYQWLPQANNLSCLTCPTPSGIVVNTQQYNIRVTSTNGCTATDSVLVSILCDKANIFVPNVFTPNNDGVNDYFYVTARGYNIINKLVMYNRWGQKVYERYNFLPNIPNLGWNGVSGNSNTINNGTSATYVYYLQATCDAGQTHSQKGTVVLIK